MKLKYKRVLLKISGEALMGDEAFGIDPSTVSRITINILKKIKLTKKISINLYKLSLSSAGSKSFQTLFLFRFNFLKTIIF